MRNLKKFLALVLATMMLLSVAVFSANAADEADYTDAANHLAALQVMKGNENGDLMLGNGVTRYQAALFFVQALTGETDVAVWNADKKSAIFTDVPEYGTAIDHANGIGIVKGRGNGIFGYNDAITYQDMLVMAVRALGYETEGMSYPYGYILAAQKLGLTENVENVNYKAALTRGETAQIIWDMLGTEVAVIDPLTDKVLYPGETGLTDAITETATERVTLLEDSGLAGAKLETAIVDFVEADEDDEESFDTVELANGLVLAAADFGITAETRKVTYMGLPVEVFVSVDEEDFTQDAYDDGDATVVFASFATYTDVLNLADGNVKFVENTTDEAKSYFSFGGTKLTVGKYVFAVAAFVDGAWTVVDNGSALAANFLYDTKDGYVTEGANAYGQVSYRVTDTILVDEETGDEYTFVEVLYTPFSFGQYNVREINDNKYTVIATYEDTAVENLDEEMSNFVEYLVDGAQKVTVNTTKITNKKGEAALTVAVEGAAVEAGDFMFYAYNETDNVLTVAANAGKFETGRLTAQNSTKETVKINGTNYEFGFNGFATEWAEEFDSTTNKEYIAELEAGKDNVKFLVVGGNIVYMEATSEATTASTYDFAIVTTDAEIMADLLDMTDDKYAAAIEDTCGFYVENGAIKVAMMDKATGEWVLADIAGYNTEWDAEEAEFVNEYTDLVDAIKYYDITANADKYGYIDDLADLVAANIVAVVAEDNGAYTIAANEADFFVYGDTEDGLLFSDSSAKTNAITADNDVDAARVTVDDETVIIVVAGATAGSRTGVQAKDNSVEVEGYFLAANADLIVFVATEEFDVADWADAKAANSDENWYLTTLTSGVEVEAGETEDDPYVVTITDVYDMKAMAIIDSIQMEVEDLDDVLSIEGVGTILFKNASDEITVTEADFEDIIIEVANDNEDELEYTIADAFDWIDADTVVLGDITKAEAVTVNATVVTLDWTGVEADEYDYDAVVGKVWTEESEADDIEITYNGEDATHEVYELVMELVDEITEPTEGVYDSAIANYTGEIYVPTTESDDYSDGIVVNVDFYTAYNYDEGVVNVVIYKVITLAD